MKKTITIISEEFKIIKMKQTKYKNNVSVLQHTLMRGLEDIIKSL